MHTCVAEKRQAKILQVRYPVHLMSESSKKRRALIPLLLTVFIDLLGFGIVIPTLAPLFYQSNAIFGPETSEPTRGILYGLLLASFSGAQFFGAPVLGTLSDRWGRKPTLIMALLGTCVGYVLFAIGVKHGLLALLFIGRLADGFMGGSISIALSAIADVSDHKEKTGNFGLIGVAFGLGFILGPAIGGKLADPSIHASFTIATPFWFAAGLTAVNIILFLLLFPETLITKRHVAMHPFIGFHNLHRALEMKHLRAILLMSFLLTLGFTFFTQFFQVYLIHRFAFDPSRIGDIFAYIGIWIALTQCFMTRPVSKNWRPDQILAVAPFILSVTLLIILFIPSPQLLILLLPFTAIAQGLTHPNVLSMISNLAHPEEQGEMLGIQQAINSLAMTLPPIIAGSVASVHITLPLILASIFVFAAWATLMIGPKHHETSPKNPLPDTFPAA
jgi:DHA1 family tetracycline resistance protein-like MFS transporter